MGVRSLEPRMISVEDHAPPPAAPRWLVWLAIGSAVSGLAALSIGLWAKWGLVIAMSQDLLKYCF